MKHMSDISKHVLIIIGCYFLVTISQTVVAKPVFQQNETNNSKQIPETAENQMSFENFTALDYYFFSYDVIDHKTLLVKFDITRALHFQQSKILYDAYLYVSKIPSINYKINIGPFSGLYEKELDGTITDHFTFCLVLIPNRYQKKFNITSSRNRTKSIFPELLKSSYQARQQQIMHYCTKMGPDEDRHRDHIKQGSKGDRTLLLLQLMMIGIFLAIIQIAHIFRNRKYIEWRLRQIHRFHHEVLSQKEYPRLSHDASELLHLTMVNEDDEEQEDEENEEVEEEKEDSETLSHRRLPSPITILRRTRSVSPSIGSDNNYTDTFSVEHILESKPWLQTPR